MISATGTGEIGLGATAVTTAGLTLPTATTAKEPLNLGSATTTVSPSTIRAGAVWINATDGLNFSKAGTKLIACDLSSAQTISAVKTFSTAPVISSTVASNANGGLWRRFNFGLNFYEAGHQQDILTQIYTTTEGSDLTNTTTETDFNGTPVMFGSRTLSSAIMQLGNRYVVRNRLYITNSVENTLTLRLRNHTISGGILATATIVGVASNRVIDVDFEGCFIGGPNASTASYWNAHICGDSDMCEGATAVGSRTVVATNVSKTMFVTAQWTNALETSSVRQVCAQINIL